MHNPIYINEPDGKHAQRLSYKRSEWNEKKKCLYICGNVLSKT